MQEKNSEIKVIERPTSENYGTVDCSYQCSCKCSFVFECDLREEILN